MKHEWRKHEKNLYGAKQNPRLINVPSHNYIMINGKGNPNNIDFSERVAALYSLAYAIKMDYKTASINKDFTVEVHDFTVYPLEGVWQQIKGNELVKEDLEYTIMIRQPDFIAKDMMRSALEKTKQKKKIALLDEIYLESNQEERCVEILHIGSFDDEPASLEKMEEFAKQNGFKCIKSCHREIYLNNANRVPENKLQSILRYQVE